MTHLSLVLKRVFQPSRKVLEQIRSKAHWSLLILLSIVCFLFPLGEQVFSDIALLRDRSLSLEDIRIIFASNVPWAVLTPFALCVFWVVQYLVIRLLRGRGSFLEHGWVNFVCFTPCVIAVVCLSLLPLNRWVALSFLLPLPGLFFICMLNIWMMSIIHGVRWKAALASTLLGALALILLVTLYLSFGIIEFPHPS